MANDELEDIFRMPAVLGRAPGPRNMPKDREHLRFAGDTTMLSVRALVEPEALARILPPRCRLLGDPVLDVNVMVQTNLGWLAGRGYNFLVLRVPVVFDSPGGEVQCSFSPVLWENKADPIITGRDELGSPKLFASIPDPARIGDRYECSADWEGFRFFDMQVEGLKAASAPPEPALPLLLYRYLSRSGDWKKADISQMVRAHKGLAPPPQIHEHLVGEGRFAFRHARWEDMPTQYTFVNTLADLPLREFRGARLVRMSGISDLAAQEIIG